MFIQWFIVSVPNYDLSRKVIRMESTLNRILVTTPYRENAVLAIARAAAADGRLSQFYTTLYLARWQSKVKRMPVFGQSLAREFARRAFADIPQGNVADVAVPSELLHVAARRVVGRVRPQWNSNLMYWTKRRFDRAVAKRVQRRAADVLVGMYAASLESFRAIKAQSGIAVLNFVNSHPAEHNRYLIEMAGLCAPHQELVPDWVADRVQEELRLADWVLVPSHFVEAQLLEHGVPAHKIKVLPYGVDLRSFHPRQQTSLGGSATTESGPLECLYVGQISHRKGIKTLFEAARLCSHLPLRFRLIGPVVSAEVLEDMPDNVTHEGPTRPDEVATAMRRADMFVLPTIEDACALVTLEAMASGLPVVTTTNNGSGEMIEDGVDGFVISAGDAAAVAEAIVRLFESAELRESMGVAARRKVQTAHTWNVYGASVLNSIGDYLNANSSDSHDSLH
ncbi:glycosyltransferase family 4 protein [Salinisphaera sp. LB1]|uniref:glycosyltransferase family 4 protein n=1 Tax=Salinisphaera sp. LB1 TaxID=2183911 RepID=UPI000D70581D|nr:glycosyltransferase family 4 protein [Salinisphaera sp. LB1]AWN17519.1 glycosyl transferase, group 1 family protein [Salinisphaera sp. LB1]